MQAFLRKIWEKYIRKVNIYWLIVIFFFVITFVTGDSNLYKRYVYDEKIRSLEKEIQMYRDEIEANKQKLESLRTDKEGLERFAREVYLMKKPDEDVFVIKEKTVELLQRFHHETSGIRTPDNLIKSQVLYQLS